MRRREKMAHPISVPTGFPEPSTWRELLATLISDPHIRAHAVAVTGLTEVTLKRWSGRTKRTTTPRSYMLKPLVVAFPEYTDLFTRLIVKDFPDFSPHEQSAYLASGDDAASVSGKMTLALYNQILALRATVPPSQLFWSVCESTLNTALHILASGGGGVSMCVCQCIVNGKQSGMREVWCLRERVQFGTSPWKHNLAPTLFLGSESLSGYAVSKGQPAICQNTRKNPTFLPLRQDQHEESAVAFPILFGERVAGCLLVKSTQHDYFTLTRVTLIERIAHLLSLAFQQDDFCERSEIHLREMPQTSEQRHYFASFRERVFAILYAREARLKHMTIAEAEAVVWTQLASELSSRTHRG